MNILTISLMNSCNRACLYCPVKKWLRPLSGERTQDDIDNNRPPVNQITNELLLRWLDTYISPNEWILEFTGGEPGLYPEINTLIPELVVRNFRGLIKTNGTLPIPKSENFQLITAWHQGVENIPEYYDQILIIKNPSDNWQRKVEYCDANNIPYKTVLFDRQNEGVRVAPNLCKINKTVYCMHICSTGIVSCCAASNLVPEHDIQHMIKPVPFLELMQRCPRCKNINDVEMWLPPDLMAKFEADYNAALDAPERLPVITNEKQERTHQEKVLIGTPGRHIESAVVKAVFTAAKKYPNSEYEITAGYGVADNRNTLARQAIDEGFEYLLFVDDDVVIPENTIDVLLDCMERTNTLIASGWYKSSFGNDLLSAARYDKHKNYYEQYNIQQWENQPGEFIKIDGNGKGVCLIKTEAFKKLRYPYFKFVEYENRACLSEDLYFFDELRKIGENNHYAVRDLKAGHIKKAWL